MFEAGKVYTNRYGDEYTWVILGEGKYQFRCTGDSMKYCRFGGKEGQNDLDFNDLGMFDPSGGPYVTLEMEIDNQPITKMWIDEDNNELYVSVEND